LIPTTGREHHHHGAALMGAFGSVRDQPEARDGTTSTSKGERHGRQHRSEQRRWDCGARSEKHGMGTCDGRCGGKCGVGAEGRSYSDVKRAVGEEAGRIFD
jgi:hypothetical protein